MFPHHRRKPAPPRLAGGLTDLGALALAGDDLRNHKHDATIWRSSCGGLRIDIVGDGDIASTSCSFLETVAGSIRPQGRDGIRRPLQGHGTDRHGALRRGDGCARARWRAPATKRKLKDPAGPMTIADIADEFWRPRQDGVAAERGSARARAK